MSNQVGNGLNSFASENGKKKVIEQVGTVVIGEGNAVVLHERKRSEISGLITLHNRFVFERNIYVR